MQRPVPAWVGMLRGGASEQDTEQASPSAPPGALGRGGKCGCHADFGGRCALKRLLVRTAGSSRWWTVRVTGVLAVRWVLAMK
ncbi:hypothetical protein GCM10009565_57470 [Amycolatopsis albidoflavus]